MRGLFLLLLLANLAFAAYAHFREGRRSDEAQLVKLQMNADKVKLVRAEGAPGAQAKAAPAPKTALACLEWGAFAGAETGKAQAALARVQLQERAGMRESPETTGFWVYIPPLKLKPDLDRKLAELKALGVQEVFVVQDNNQWKNAISLGIFRTEDAANGFLAKLRERGVKSALVGSRSGLVRLTTFVVRDPDDAAIARLTELKQEFAGSELKAVPCPSS